MMYLLNKPNKKSKQNKYDKHVSKLVLNLDSKNSLKVTKEENSKVIETIHNLKSK